MMLRIFDYISEADIGHIVYCSGMHFLLSASAGLLVYWLTSTTLSVTCSAYLCVSFIRRFSLLVALCCAVAAHILEDYWLGSF
jgi:hypothetical protein